MKETLKRLYNLELKCIVRKSDKVYLLECKQGKYILKYVKLNMENIYLRLAILRIDYFLLPLKSTQGKYIEYFEEKYFTISSYSEEEALLSKDVRLSVYIKAIGELHEKSPYPLRVGDRFLEESITFLDGRVEALQNDLDTRMQRVEKEDYHSPSDWFFLNNYHHFSLALKEVSRHILRLEESFKEEKELSLCLTYQNFSFDHILLSSSKLTSLEKMAIAPSIYDLYDLITHLSSETISLTSYIKEYLGIHKLKKYEMEWLFALLFLPPLERKKEDIDDITSLANALKYLKRTEELATSIYSEEETS